MFLYDQHHAILAVYPVICFHALYYRGPQAKLTVIKVIQWWLVLPGQALDVYFRSHILQTVVSVSRAAAPKSSCCLAGRCDFLLWGSSRTSAGCQTQLGELLARALSLSVHFSPLLCVGLCTCQIKAQWIWTEIIVSCSLHLALPPCCCNGDDNRAAASKQPQSILRLEGQDWGADYPGPLLHIDEGCRSTQLITQTCLTLVLQDIHWWKNYSDPLLN